MQLVINTFGASLRKKGDRFVVRAGSNKLVVSAQKVQSILITTAVQLSSDVITLAVDHKIDIIFLEKTGEPVARLWPHRMGSTAAIRRRQLEAALGLEGVEIAREWICAKLRHQLEFLDELRLRRSDRISVFDGPMATIQESLTQLEGIEGRLDDQRARLLGLEGSAGPHLLCLPGTARSRAVPLPGPEPPARSRWLQRDAQLCIRRTLLDR